MEKVALRAMYMAEMFNEKGKHICLPKPSKNFASRGKEGLERKCCTTKRRALEKGVRKSDLKLAIFYVRERRR